MAGLLSKLVRFLKTIGHRISGGFFIVRPLPKDAGKLGEYFATQYLRKLGLRILAQGHRTSRSEIDIIALDQKTIVFVEVKTWKRGGEGGPSDAVDLEKQRRLTRAALVYLKKHRLLQQPSRFDVIEVILEPDSLVERDFPAIRHFKNAFEAQGNFQMFC